MVFTRCEAGRKRGGGWRMPQARRRKRPRKARADGSTAACSCLRRRWRKRRTGWVACRGELRDSRRFCTCANAGRGSHACAATSATSPRRNQRSRRRGRRACWGQLDGCGGAGGEPHACTPRFARRVGEAAAAAAGMGRRGDQALQDGGEQRARRLGGGGQGGLRWAVAAADGKLAHTFDCVTFG